MIAVGVDAGGTTTIAAAARSGRRGAAATGPGANLTTAGVAAAGAIIVTTIRAALAGDQPDSIHIGAAGAGRPDLARALAALVGAVFPLARVTVGHDATIALRSLIADGAGVVLVAGTGSVAYAEHGDVSALVGGHGWLLGDEGSAFALGMAALRLAARVRDGRAARDETTDLVERALHAPDRAALHAAVYTGPLEPARIAALAPSIVAFAGKGNRASTKIVQEAAKDLGDLLRSAARGAGLLEASPPIALTGGLLRENSLLTFLLETRINGDFTGSAIVRGPAEPVAGALRLAERAVAPA